MFETEGTLYCSAPRCRESTIAFFQQDFETKTNRVVLPPEVPPWSFMPNGSCYCPVCAVKHAAMQKSLAERNGKPEQ